MFFSSALRIAESVGDYLERKKIDIQEEMNNFWKDTKFAILFEQTSYRYTNKIHREENFFVMNPNGLARKSSTKNSIGSLRKFLSSFLIWQLLELKWIKIPVNLWFWINFVNFCLVVVKIINVVEVLAESVI